MKRLETLKEVLKYQIFFILFGAFIKNKSTPLQISWNRQESAKNITFKWGICSALGVMTLVYMFVILRYISSAVALILIAIAFVLVCYILSSLVSCVYLYIVVRLMQKEEEEEKKKRRHNKNIGIN